MVINFDTANMSPAEVRGLIALLSTTFFEVANAPAAQFPTPKNEEQAVFGVPAQDASAAENTTTEAPATDAPAKRHRRTKAEIAADEAAAAGAQQTIPAEEPALAQPVAEAQPATEAAAKPSQDKPISADELRALLNAYIAKHSMEAAIEQLRAFDCIRVSDAMTLEPSKLSKLTEALRG